MKDGRIEDILAYLGRHGINYPPLKEEMLDHIVCDIEHLVKAGYSYDDAWQKVLNEIPPKQLQTLQIETMETIDKKESLSKVFAYLSFFLLFAGSVFKLMKFPGAGQLLISSFIAIALALVSGSAFGMIANREKRGVWLLVAVLAGVLLFLASFTFQILHLPGATELRTIGVVSLCLTFATSFFYLRGGDDYILLWLHERYALAIERFIVVLFVAVFIMRMPSLLLTFDDPVSRVLLIILIASAGLHFHALNWSFIKKDKAPGVVYLVALTVSFLCFQMPFIPNFLSVEVRSFLIAILWPVAGTIAAIKGTNEDNERTAAIGSTVIVTSICTFSAMIGMELLPFSMAIYGYNAAIICLLLSILILFRKSPLYRTYMVIVISNYLFVYPWEIGLW